MAETKKNMPTCRIQIFAFKKNFFILKISFRGDKIYHNPEKSIFIRPYIR